MPTDETALEALAALLAGWEAALDQGRVLDDLTPVEERLIADALRFRLAALTAPAAQAGE